nr:MAG TPA: capsid protein [Caudoviricetes sp.]
MYWDKRKEDQSKYMGHVLFKPKKIVGLEINKIGGRSGLPVQLKASAFDTQAVSRDRLSIELTKQSMPFFRERMPIDETLRQQIIVLQNEELLKGFMSQIFDDTNNLIRGAKVRREKMAMELISTGHIKIEDNGVKLDYNYNLSKQQFVESDWSNTATSTPIQDLIDWVDFARTKLYVNMGYAIMTTKTFNLIKASESTRKAMFPLVAATNIDSMLITNQQVKDFVQNATGLRILLNDTAYAEHVGGSGMSIYPDMRVTLIPEGGVLGDMVFGTTPEEIDLLGKVNTGAEVSIVDTGVAVTTRTKVHPVSVETFVSQICLPSFSSDIENGSGSIMIAKLK